MGLQAWFAQLSACCGSAHPTSSLVSQKAWELGGDGVQALTTVGLWRA